MNGPTGPIYFDDRVDLATTTGGGKAKMPLGRQACFGPPAGGRTALSPRSIFASVHQSTSPTMTNDRHETIRKGSALIGLLLSLLAPAANSLSLKMPPPSSAAAVTRSLSRSRFLSSTAGSLFVAASASAAALVGDPEECAARDLLKGVSGYGGGSAARVGDNPRYLDQELEMKYGEGENYKMEL